MGEGIKILPGLILDIAPDLGLALAKGLADALLDFPDRVAEAIVEAITGRDADTKGDLRNSIEVTSAAADTGDPLTVAFFAAMQAIRGDSGRGGDRSRSAAEADLASGYAAPPVGTGRDRPPVSVALTVRGSGVGMQRAIDLDTGAYGRLLGAR